MPDTGPKNLINLNEADLDKPVYRIYSIERFMDLLESKTDALVNPAKWDDPFENFALQRTIVDDGHGQKMSLQKFAGEWYGQCWSLKCESDAMWRIYSPHYKALPAVKIKTTMRKIFENLKANGSHAPYLQFFIGKVQYFESNAITEFMKKQTFTDFTMGGDNSQFAELLCIKRLEFEHESEVRLLYSELGQPADKKGSNGVFKYTFDANKIADEVVVDPRISETAFKIITGLLKASGCKIPIAKSQLYEAPDFEIKL